MTEAFTGSCLCGAVSFRLQGPLRQPRYCHCEYCRKFSGTSPASWAMAHRPHLETNQQTELIRYDSGHGIRCSCGICGSPVWFESKDYADVVGIPLGLIDEGEVPTPEFHLWTDSMPTWCELNDDLPKYPQGP